MRGGASRRPASPTRRSSQNPTTTRTLDGRTYRFYFNGPHLHLVAFTYRKRVYWVINTLLDDLTNPEMVAIARSMKPTG